MTEFDPPDPLPAPSVRREQGVRDALAGKPRLSRDPHYVRGFELGSGHIERTGRNAPVDAVPPETDAKLAVTPTGEIAMGNQSAVELSETWARLAAQTASRRPDYVIEAARAMLSERQAQRREAEAAEASADQKASKAI